MIAFLVNFSCTPCNGVLAAMAMAVIFHEEV
jgi:hypothetical protein